MPSSNRWTECILSLVWLLLPDSSHLFTLGQDRQTCEFVTFSWPFFELTWFSPNAVKNMLQQGSRDYTDRQTDIRVTTEPHVSASKGCPGLVLPLLHGCSSTLTSDLCVWGQVSSHSGQTSLNWILPRWLKRSPGSTSLFKRSWFHFTWEVPLVA